MEDNLPKDIIHNMHNIYLRKNNHICMKIQMQSKTLILLMIFLNSHKLTNHNHIRAKHFMIH
jgi:hypothetical protein